MDESERPLKRARLNHDNALKLLNEELSTEIGLQERLAATLEARIAWATLLQDVLLEGPSEPFSRLPPTSLDDIEDNVLGALNTLDSPASLLFSVPPLTVPPLPYPNPVEPSTIVHNNLNGNKAKRKPPRRSTFGGPSHGAKRGSTSNAIRNPRAFLFTNMAPENPQGGEDATLPIPHVLVCPICSQTLFYALQGLLNHVRMSHQSEFGSHDACVAGSAVRAVVSIEYDEEPVLSPATEIQAETEAVTPQSASSSQALPKRPCRTIFTLPSGAVFDSVDGICIPAGSGVPSLRRMFEMALDGSNSSNPLLTLSNLPMGLRSSTKAENTSSSTLLSRTLGLHKDTPALALFLGRAPKQRCIQVSGDQNVIIDIGSELQTEDHTSSEKPQSKWKMTYHHRNAARAGFDDVLPESTASHGLLSPERKEEEEEEEAAISPEAAEVPDDIATTGEGTTRFHKLARLTLTDRSLFLPLEKREGIPDGHTHKWMIAVDAPAYSSHITSFVTRLSITPLPNHDPKNIIPPPSAWPPSINPVSSPTLSTKVSTTKRSNSPLITRSLTTVTREAEEHTRIILSTDKPPFIIVGTAGIPFLAQVTLRFVPTPGGAKQEKVLEHWVDLDPYHVGHPVNGDEQTVDAALDKGSVLRPPITDYVPINTKGLWDGTAVSKKDKESLAAAAASVHGPTLDSRVSEPPTHAFSTEHRYEDRLKELLPQFPMTLKDVKPSLSVATKAGTRRQQAQTVLAVPVPYRLVASHAELNMLILGRRKAIEFGRAHALCEAYNASMHSADVHLIPLTPADVYVWLAENGHFPRATVGSSSVVVAPNSSKKDSNKLDHDRIVSLENTRFCGVCGLSTSLHADTQRASKNESLVLTPFRNNPPTDPFVCDIVEKDRDVRLFSAVDIHTLFAPQISSKVLSVGMHVRNWRWRPDQIIPVARPQLTAKIHEIMNKIVLSSRRPFQEEPKPASSSIFPLDHLGATKAQVDSELAASALLSLLTNSLVRTLVRNGLEVATNDKELTRKLDNRGRRMKLPAGMRVLTPSHIIRGIHASSNVAPTSSVEPNIGQVLAMAFSKPAFPVGHPTNEQSNENVKMADV